jgi:hypothetical protein
MSGITAMILLVIALFPYFVTRDHRAGQEVAEFWIDLHRQPIPWLDAFWLGRRTRMDGRGNSANQIRACLSSQNRNRVIPHLPTGELQTGYTVAAPPRCG